jgi:hypothetical protein
MKKFTFLCLAIIAVSGLSAQNNKYDGTVEVTTCEHFSLSQPLSKLFEENQPSTNFVEHGEMRESKDIENRKAQTFIETNDVDPVVQSEYGSFTTKSLVNWGGQTGSSCPPDPTGAVGTNYYVQAINATPFKIFNKTTGTQVGTVRQLGNLWSPTVSNDGDPIVLYDKFADRWFMAQFKFSGSYKIYIAISTTNDPTGTYYCYTFSSSQMPDYGKFSIWQDGYYMTSNQNTQKVLIFERAQMLLGNTSSRMITKNFTTSPPSDGGFFCPLSADADGQLPPAGTPCPIFTYEDNGWGAGYVDRINIYNLAVNWVPTTPTATFTGPTQLPTLAFDASYDGGWLDISQYGSTQKLDGIGGVFTFRAQHRVWTGYNSVVLCMGVKTGVGTQRGIRWFELRQTGGVWSIYQQGTYGPADGLNRWVGSIAMDDNGSIGMAYAVAGSGGTGGNVYPSIRYTGRRAGDLPLGTMSFAETTAIAGTGAITNCSQRFGDYSHTSLDPSDGLTFWHTGEYGTSGGGYGTRIFSFQIPLVTGIEEEKNLTSPGVIVYKSGFNINIKADHLPSNNQMVIDLFDINGQKITGKTIVPISNSFETTFNVQGLATGTYLVRVGEPNTSFQKVTKVIIE